MSQKLVTIDNETMCVGHWAKRYGKSANGVNRYWNDHPNLTLLQVLQRAKWERKTYRVGNRMMTVKQMSLESGLKVATINSRIKRGIRGKKLMEPLPYHYITAWGIRKPIQEWCKEKKILASTVRYRMDDLKMTPEQALSAPVVKQPKVWMITAWGITQSADAWAKEKKKSKGCIRHRIKVLKMTPEEALSAPHLRRKGSENRENKHGT